MAYISKRDARPKTDSPANKGKKHVTTKPRIDLLNDDDDIDWDDDLDGEDDYTFKKSLDTEFPLSGGETDEDE